MKKLLLSSVLFIPSLVFSYELGFNKTFSKSIKNDTLQTNVNIKIDSKNIDYINEKIEFFQDFINDNSTVTKKNGTYNLTPNYVYQNKEKKFMGYNGLLNYSIESSEYEKINYFINELTIIKNNMNTQNVKLSISNLKWIVSKELYEKNIDKMRIESIIWVKNYMKKIDDNCNIENISINQNNQYPTLRYAKSSMIESSPSFNITPSQTKQLIELKTNYKLICK